MSEFNGVPPYNGIDLDDWLKRARLVVNGSLNGKTNNTGSFTLATSTVSTTVVLALGRLGPDTVILPMPLTANAAAEIGAGTMWVSSRNVATGKFVLTHASNTQADRTFNFIMVG